MMSWDKTPFQEQSPVELHCANEHTCRNCERKVKKCCKSKQKKKKKKKTSDFSNSSFGRISWSKVSERRLVQLW